MRISNSRLPFCFFAAIVFSLLHALPSSSLGALVQVFDNGNHVTNGSLAARDDPGFVYHEADHFQLASSAAITALTWKGFYGTPLPSDNFRIRFYADNGAGAPTSPPVTAAIYSAAPTIFDKHLTGEVNGPEIFYQYSATIPAFNAAGGTQYWLEIFNDIPTGNSWSWADDLYVGGKQYFAVEGQLPNWADNGFNSKTTFQLFTGTVPEPTTITLLALGAVGLLIVRRWPSV